MPPNPEVETSFPEMVYPSLRDVQNKSPQFWMKGKAMDDGAEGLWRIYDKLYDFNKFAKVHPGGEQWLTMTKGTDITEAFESHHIATFPKSMLSKFFVRNAKGKRNSPFTFQENGFYNTLKRRIREDLKRVPKDFDWAPKRIIEGFLVGTFLFAILACRIEWIWARVLFIIMAALSLAGMTACAHNFLHKKNNWRMYLLNFSFLAVREFRISHALSHHLFPNTLLDLEVSGLEPILQWMPRKSKSIFARYGPIIYGPFVYTLVFTRIYLGRIFATIFQNEFFIAAEDLIALILPTTMYFVGGCGFYETFIIWMAIIHTCSFVFTGINFNAAHHHPDIFHDGDAPRIDRDWGLHQLHAVMDRIEINGSIFKVLLVFGDHGLHHLFPTLDHAALPYLEDSFIKTCKEFKTELRMTTQFQMFIGSYRQMARTECNKKAY